MRPCHPHRPIRRNLSTAQLLWNASHSRTEAATLLFCETSTSPFRQEPSPHWWALPEPEKSTVAKLIAGTYEPTEGVVKIGTVPRNELPPSTSRSAVALVTQEVHVFAGTLAEDLRLADPSATDNDITAALDTVGASDWLRALPGGLETVVGDGGHRLTATQAQQLALARIELLDPPLLILDEATAEAGSAGARVLDDAALALTRGRTAVTVAHRLSQAVDADQILVMDDGRVVEHGSHDELVNLGGRYAELWEAWSAPRR